MINGETEYSSLFRWLRRQLLEKEQKEILPGQKNLLFIE